MKNLQNQKRKPWLSSSAKLWLILGFSSLPALAEKGINDDFTIADGSPLTLDGKGLTITPPAGWQILASRPGQSLVLRAPEEANQKYQRTIQVLSFAGPAYIDALEAERFAPTIVRNFSDSSGIIEDYRIRNHLPVDLESGVSGHLFYAEFKVTDEQLMQMHVLVSSANRHYVLTFTDLAESFDTEKGNDAHLNEAWKTLNSVTLESSGPARFSFPLKVTLLVVGISLLGFFFNRTRGKRASKQYTAEMKKMENDDVDDYVPSPKHAVSATKSLPPLSRIPTHKSQIPLSQTGDDEEENGESFDAFEDDKDQAS